MEKVKLIAIIENRIKDEYRKHKELDWPLIAAVKIAGTVIEMFPEVCDGKADGTSEKDLRVCEVIASAWISVKDQMPPKNEDVLVLKKNRLITIMCYFGIDGDYQIRWFSFGKWLDQTSQITHWMPLPCPPAK
jgi:hypothetical protein